MVSHFTNFFLMKQRAILNFKSTNAQFLKKMVKEKKVSISKIVDEYLDLLQRIDKKLSQEKLDTWVKKFGGIVNIGINEDIKSIYRN